MGDPILYLFRFPTDKHFTADLTDVSHGNDRTVRHRHSMRILIHRSDSAADGDVRSARLSLIGAKIGDRNLWPLVKKIGKHPQLFIQKRAGGFVQLLLILGQARRFLHRRLISRQSGKG